MNAVLFHGTSTRSGPASVFRSLLTPPSTTPFSPTYLAYSGYNSFNVIKQNVINTIKTKFKLILCLNSSFSQYAIGSSKKLDRWIMIYFLKESIGICPGLRCAHFFTPPFRENQLRFTHFSGMIVRVGSVRKNEFPCCILCTPLCSCPALSQWGL
jgi:hypothetical protein